MFRSSKLILIVAGALAGLIVLVAAVAAYLLRQDAKPRLEALASQALAMEVKVDGGFSVGFLPRLHIALTDVHASKQGVEIASADEIKVGIALLPLLRKEVRIRTIGLNGLQIAIERDRDGILNISRSPRSAATFPALSVAKISVSDAALLYSNRQTGKELEAMGCDMDVSRMRLSSGQAPGLLANLSLAAELACGRIRTNGFAASDVQVSIEGKDGVFDLSPARMVLFGGQGSGSLRADYSGSVSVYQLDFSLAKFRMEEFFRQLFPRIASQEKAGNGALDFSTKLSLRGKSFGDLKPSAAGEASLHGENLRLEIGDLDRKFSRYESSQSFNLVDVGAVFFAGPLALGVTKGYDFARIFEGGKGSTRVRVLVSRWRVEHGVAHATDVAMATEKNRVALTGGLNFVTARFEDVTMALIDDHGCARAKQKIRGPFSQPKVEKPDVMRTLAGPARALVKEAKDLFGGKCEVFYAGSVEPPG
jgi:AsmA protein